MKKLTCLLAILSITLGASTQAADRPNILFIAVDDLRPELGVYGQKHIKSPNIDALARTGVTFDRAYCQQAVCSPTRSSLMTGARPDTTKVWDLVTHFRVAMPDVVTLSQHFKQNGYFVQGMGKLYHGGLNDEPSWSVAWQSPRAPTYALAENIALNARLFEEEPDDVLERNAKAGKIPKAIQPAADRRRWRGPAFEGADVPDNYFTDGKVAELAVETLGTLSKKKEPFFLAIGFIKPHLPFVAPKKYWDMYDPAKIVLAPNKFFPIDAPAYAIRKEGSELGNYYGIPDGSLPDDVARQLKHGYFSAISYMDAQLGKVMAELDRLDLRKNTIVILWGDHGWKLGEHDTWAKHANTENDTNVPLIISVPGMKNANSHTNALVEFVDIYPSLSELAGLPLPKHLEGTSFKPLLDNLQRPWKQAAFSQYHRNVAETRSEALMGYTMRTDRYRFTVWVARDNHDKVDAIELYDHQTDPQENRNIAKLPANAALVAQLMTQWRGGWKAAVPKNTAAR